MEYFPAPLEKLTEQFARLPGVGRKSAQRLAFFVLGLPMEEAQAFADAIVDAKKSVTLCPVCQNLTAGGLCPVCASPKRDESTICVVADPRDVLAIERSREYNGRYHVLHGVLSPMNHVGPGTGGRRWHPGGHHGHQSRHRGGDHGYVSIKAAKALRGEGHPAGLRHPRGRTSGICR